ncbi:MFS transporter [Catenulispora yoronensis]
MNIADFFLGGGSLVMPILIAKSLEAGAGLRWAYWFTAAFTVALGIWFRRLLPGPEPTARSATGTDTDDARRYRVVAVVAALLFLYVGMEISFSGWIPAYAVSRGITGSTAAAAYFSSLFWIAVTVGRLLWLPLAARRPPEQLVAAGFAAAPPVWRSRSGPGRHRCRWCWARSSWAWRWRRSSRPPSPCSNGVCGSPGRSAPCACARRAWAPWSSRGWSAGCC